MKRKFSFGAALAVLLGSATLLVSALYLTACSNDGYYSDGSDSKNDGRGQGNPGHTPKPGENKLSS